MAARQTVVRGDTLEVSTEQSHRETDGEENRDVSIHRCQLVRARRLLACPDCDRWSREELGALCKRSGGGPSLRRSCTKVPRLRSRVQFSNDKTGRRMGQGTRRRKTGPNGYRTSSRIRADRPSATGESCWQESIVETSLFIQDPRPGILRAMGI